MFGVSFQQEQIQLIKSDSKDTYNAKRYPIQINVEVSICWLILKKKCISYIKGIVHHKMKILSPFTHPQVVSNLYECVCSAEHKGRYSEECGKQSSSGAPLTSIVFLFSYHGSQLCPETAWLQTLFKISSFVCSRTKKCIQVWSYLRVNNDRIFIFENGGLSL